MLFCWDFYNRFYHSRHPERRVKKKKKGRKKRAHIWNQTEWHSFDTPNLHSVGYTAQFQARSPINWLRILKSPLKQIPEYNSDTAKSPLFQCSKLSLHIIFRFSWWQIILFCYVTLDSMVKHPQHYNDILSCSLMGRNAIQITMQQIQMHEMTI
jgi:hypothetical protein